MLDRVRCLSHGLRSLVARLQQQGWRQVCIGQGIPKLTGVPSRRYSRITAYLYVGPQIGRAGKKQLERWGVTGSINMRAEYDDAAHHLALTQYCYLPTLDGQAPTREQLEHGIAFIHKVLGEGGKVYIHCQSGVGRAPTMAAAYLLSQGSTLAEVLTLIGRARPFIALTGEQLERLRTFEQRPSA